MGELKEEVMAKRGELGTLFFAADLDDRCNWEWEELPVSLPGTLWSDGSGCLVDE